MIERRRRLVYILLGALVLCLPWWLWFWCGQATTLLVVRHADRQGTDDALTVQGAARAQEVVHLAEKAGVVAIYRSDTNRARDTVAPLAAALGLAPVVYPANNVATLVSDIFADHRGEAVFVVGHSNTVPQIIALAGGPTVPNIDESEYDNLFVLTACRCRRGSARLVTLQYGALSP